MATSIRLHAKDEKSLEPYFYLTQAPGKNIRDLFMDALNDWLCVKEDVLDVLKTCVGMLHNASLLIDDIEDESKMRRGLPTAHEHFGVARTLNAGNYVYFLAMQELMARLPASPERTLCLEIYCEEMCNLHRGQGKDIWWREAQCFPTLKEYESMVLDKTGGLFRMASRMMWVYSNCEQSQDDVVLLDLANSLALYFQIRDDLINLASPKYHESKGFCEDITEGKLSSFVVLHALRNLGDETKVSKLREILQAKPTNHFIIKQALVLINSAQSFDFTIKHLAAIKLELLQAIGTRSARLYKLVEAISLDVEQDCMDVEQRVIKGGKM